MTKPPTGKRIPTELSAFSDLRVDHYYWIADKNDPEVIQLLEAENEYFSEATKSNKDLAKTIYDEILSVVVEDVRSVPVKDKKWVYITRYEKNLQYPIFTRRPYVDESSMKIPEPGEQKGEDELELLDVNKVSSGFDFFNLGDLQISFNSSIMAYSFDTNGSETYEAKIVNLTDNVVIDNLVEIYASLVWHKDNSHIYYLKLDEEMRPFQVWCHKLGEDQDNDQLIYEEPDDAFFVDISTTKDDNFILVSSNSKITSEVHYIDTNLSHDNLKTFATKIPSHEYQIEHLNGTFYIITNLDAINFKVMTCNLNATSPDNWKELVAHCDDIRIESMEIFNKHIVLSKRSKADTYFEIIDLTTGNRWEFRGSVEFGHTHLSINPDIDSATLRYSEQSLKSPDAICELDLNSKATRQLWQRPYNNFDPELFDAKRYYATSADGTEIPYSLVYKRNLNYSIDRRPCLIYAYGAYEISLDPWFSPSRLSLLDRGFIFAVAHARGGGENGRQWYENGKKLKKKNTFSDVIAVAEDLIKKGLTTENQIGLRGGSAGGLTVGAVLNMAPTLFKVAVAEVPFVDTLTTMSDPTLPLTITEWDEWGNPIENSEDYFYIKSYSPYDNIKSSVKYPSILATAGLNDPRVGYFEPAKWVQKLRYANPENNVLLKTEMGAGHQGPSGRYSEYEQEAEILAFIVKALESPD